MRKYYAENPNKAEKARERARARRLLNPEFFREKEKAYKEKNREAVLARKKKYREENKEKIYAYNKAYDKANRHITAAINAKKRAKRRNAMPSFADTKAIAAIYKLAKKMTKITGVSHHVDHIVPLAGRTVCGLHVSWNLQVITATENVRKSNSWGPV